MDDEFGSWPIGAFVTGWTVDAKSGTAVVGREGQRALPQPGLHEGDRVRGGVQGLRADRRHTPLGRRAVPRLGRWDGRDPAPRAPWPGRRGHGPPRRRGRRVLVLQRCREATPGYPPESTDAGIVPASTSMSSKRTVDLVLTDRGRQDRRQAFGAPLAHQRAGPAAPGLLPGLGDAGRPSMSIESRFRGNACASWSPGRPASSGLTSRSERSRTVTTRSSSMRSPTTTIEPRRRRTSRSPSPTRARRSTSWTCARTTWRRPSMASRPSSTSRRCPACRAAGPTWRPTRLQPHRHLPPGGGVTLGGRQAVHPDLDVVGVRDRGRR